MDLPNEELSSRGHSGVVKSIRETAKEYKSGGNIVFSPDMVNMDPINGTRPIFPSRMTYVIQDSRIILAQPRGNFQSPKHRDTVATIYKALKLVDPETMSLPRCVGIAQLNSPPNEAYQLVFSIERRSTDQGTLPKVVPRTLRELLSWKYNHDDAILDFSLSSRIKLALRIARSIFYLHTTEIVHKNVRPENIIIMDDRVFPTDIGQPYLTGFEESRSESQRALSTKTQRDGDWRFRLYRHDSREKEADDLSFFEPLHDMYSLGIVLLEIGFWEPLALWQASTEGGIEDPGDIFPNEFYMMEPGSGYPQGAKERREQIYCYELSQLLRWQKYWGKHHEARARRVCAIRAPRYNSVN